MGGFVQGILFLVRCLLPAACCLLPAACCLLPAACCLLPAPAACCGGGVPAHRPHHHSPSVHRLQLERHLCCLGGAALHHLCLIQAHPPPAQAGEGRGHDLRAGAGQAVREQGREAIRPGQGRQGHVGWQDRLPTSHCVDAWMINRAHHSIKPSQPSIANTRLVFFATPQAGASPRLLAARIWTVVNIPPQHIVSGENHVSRCQVSGRHNPRGAACRGREGEERHGYHVGVCVGKSVQMC